MDSYQKHLFKIFEDFREAPAWPDYPPYKEGDYLEERFIKYFEENELQTSRYFIPVAWSSCYINHRDAPLPKLQEALLSLRPDEKYFMVGVHDDAPREKVPADTLKFLSGGNNADRQSIPVPLVVSKIPSSYLEKLNYEKIYLASFIGSMTHPHRRMIYESHQNNPHIVFQSKHWSPNVGDDQLQKFLTVSAQSNFVLCPRGYASTSYRLYETMQLNTVPVYISDNFWLPWAHEIDWNSICVFVKEDEIAYLDLILQDCLYSGEYEKKLKKIHEIYDNFFTLDVIINKIIERANQ